jgi:hypothetical protein
LAINTQAGKELKGESEFETMALKAVKLDLIEKNYPESVKLWDELKKKTMVDGENRIWYLLSAWRLMENKALIKK